MGKTENSSDHEAERVVVRPHPANPLGVRVDVITDKRPVHIDWGDSTKRDKVRRPGRKPVQHAYSEPGSYRVTALDDDGNVVARQHVVVRDHVDLNGIRVDDENGAVRLQFGDDVDDGTGVLPYYRVEWPDGDVECVWGVPGRQVRHEVIAGKHDVRVVDTTTGRVSWFDVHVEDESPADPDFDVHASREDESGMTIVLRLTAVQERPIHIWWDDADGPQAVESPQPNMEIPHRYLHPGHYLQTVSYAGELSFAATKAESMSVPTRSTNGNEPDTAGPEPEGARADQHGDSVRGADRDSARPAASGTSPVGDLNPAPTGEFPPQPAAEGDADSDGAGHAPEGEQSHGDRDTGGGEGDAAGEVEPAPIVDGSDTDTVAADSTN